MIAKLTFLVVSQMSFSDSSVKQGLVHKTNTVDTCSDVLMWFGFRQVGETQTFDHLQKNVLRKHVFSDMKVPGVENPASCLLFHHQKNVLDLCLHCRVRHSSISSWFQRLDSPPLDVGHRTFLAVSVVKVRNIEATWTKT